jgi:hypothetical protein
MYGQSVIFHTDTNTSRGDWGVVLKTENVTTIENWPLDSPPAWITGRPGEGDEGSRFQV